MTIAITNTYLSPLPSHTANLNTTLRYIDYQQSLHDPWSTFFSAALTSITPCGTGLQNSALTALILYLNYHNNILIPFDPSRPAYFSRTSTQLHAGLDLHIPHSLAPVSCATPVLNSITAPTITLPACCSMLMPPRTSNYLDF